MEKYKCGVCGKEYNSLDEYVNCVVKCSTKLKEENQKRLENINKALNAIKQAKNYYIDLKSKFKEDYPEEYEMNFGVTDHECKYKRDTKDIGEKNKIKPESVEFKREQKGNEKPKMTAKVNGKEIEDDDAIKKLFTNPDVKDLAKLLGIIQ